MYFKSEKNNTNIDFEFKNQKNTSNLISLISKYKLFIIGVLILIIIMIIIFLFFQKEPDIYIDLLGELNITIYQGTDYIEQGYKAYNSKGEDLTPNIEIKSTINTNVIGEYNIVYSIGNVTQTRKVTVIAKKKEYTYIYLTSVNNSVDIYLNIGDKYVEPGYKIFNSEGKDLHNRVKITGNVNTSKPGIYRLTYSVTDDNNITTIEERTIVVMDTDIDLSLVNDAYTNGNVKINIVVTDQYFDYTILPNNDKISTSTYTYEVNENGKYTFTTYNKKGLKKSASIEVKNIDRTKPEGTCSINISENEKSITINATDKSGIKKYIYNGNEYRTNKIPLSTFIESAQITVYDNAGNAKDISCNATSKVYINNISQNGMLVTINATKINNNISGYYFSYINQKPDKNTGGYISTSNESVEVVRLPGTTYVWIEDIYGNVVGPKTITLSNDVLPITVNKLKILEGTKLSTYLSNNNYSLEELNKLIARSVRAAGLYTKEAVATSALTLEGVLAQKFKIKLPYYWGGKSWRIGANGDWGKNSKKEANGTTYYYYGLDCTGLTTWAYVNAGYKIASGVYPDHDRKKIKFNKENGEIGDILVSDDHVKLIVGKTNNAFITVEAKGKKYGMVISEHSYSKPNGFKIQKGEIIMEKYSKIESSSYPSGY